MGEGSGGKKRPRLGHGPQSRCTCCPGPVREVLRSLTLALWPWGAVTCEGLAHPCASRDSAFDNME